MCGIAGIVHLDKAPSDRGRDAAILRASASQIAHRGPDDEQLYFWKNAGLIFRRLSIVDLEGGGQPLKNEDDSLLLITNGEIYNHRDLRSTLTSLHHFRSESDCEIILHLYEDYGLDYVDHLNGMFASALLDKRRKKLILARDRLGIKPLYYYRSDDLLVFGSEIKALFAHPKVPKEFDWHAAFSFRGSMQCPRSGREVNSFFREIQYLPGGHLLEVDLETGKIRQSAYWNPEANASAADAPVLTREKYIQKYRDLLIDSVKLQLMSDVELGVFLSGGIDSVAIACLASKHQQLDTFTVLSQSTITNGDAPSAYKAAKAFNLSNRQVFFDWRDFKITPAEWKKILWKVEMPMVGAEQLYKYNLHAYAKSERPGLKVMLVGTGSDEFNGGYSKAVLNSPEDPSWQTFESTLRNGERFSLIYHSGFLSHYVHLHANGHRIVSNDFLAHMAGQKAYEHPWHGYRDMYRYLLQMYQLWHEDRTAAANSIENRVPFLDHRLVEFTYSIPPELYEELFWDKTILREAMSEDLPQDLCQRRKVPFFIGEDERYTRRLLYSLLTAENSALIEEALAGAGHSSVFDAYAMREAIKKLPDDPEYTNVDALLDLVNMGLLSAMAKETPDFGAIEDKISVSAVEIGEWKAWEQQFGIELTKRSPKLDTHSVVRFGDGIRLVKREGGNPNAAGEGDYYLMSNNQLLFVLEPGLEEWVSFLRLVDGRRTIGQIFEAADIQEGSVWKHLEESIEYGVLHPISAMRAS